MINAFLTILPPFLIIIVGYIFGRIFPYDIKIISKISLWIMASVLSFTFINDYPPKLSYLKSYGLGILFLFILFYILSFAFKKDRFLILTNSIYINTGYLGYPILYSIWGEQAMSYGVIYSVINMLVASIVLPSFIGEKINFKNILKLPYLYVITFAYLLSIFGISYKQLPVPFIETINMLKNSAIPFLLIFTGLSLSKIKIKSVNFYTVIFSTIIRLVLYPAFALIFVFFSKMDNEFARVFVLESAMPTAINSVILIDAITGDASKISLTVAITTLLSAFTIPVWIIVLERIL
ncbi:transporter, auxin efflux carrier (AEC) family [Thermosipho africanus TCF52B]|uniref:Transporter, auxin efflux carrier (AEC) family n=1 Tax=Thermosipho africanus (strain TCF52B) TaxID=484019 RepID=B7IE13_THEAB|nr:AEC family transporter [Thermosipho africanus]ACJ76240.1 transporter, auxin efflux carrier (AEC) family [Thermosipho africanus TCF52B]